MRDKQYVGQYTIVRKVLWIILFANFAVAAVKICVGVASGSQSVFADGIHSFADGSSNIVGLIGLRLACKPCDDGHPYGHGRYEVIASLFIGIMLAAMSVRIISRAITSFGNSNILSIEIIELVLMLLTVFVNIIVAFFEYRLGRKHGSIILVTDSVHTAVDILISSAVLLALVGIRLGLPVWIDGLFSLLVAAAVLLSAWKIIKSCIDVLVDSSAVNADDVRKLLISVPGIYDVHRIRSRGDASHVFIDLHIVVSPVESLESVHALSHRLESMLREHFGENTEVGIHFEPVDSLSDDE